ncbi:MAG: 2-octaprenyl-6-methoxyphenyl hydroxylase [Gammaproteobacteria bacterium]|nr:2-octaprenyl-6-methoxyphenyl hydroxylase [Gammaproteobacteria bacterium]
MEKKVDILIHGGGLAGNSLALALAKTNLNIAIVEPFPPANLTRSILESRTIALSYGARRIYEGMGVWSEIEPYCTPIEHIHVSDQGRFGMTHIHATEQGMPALGYVLQIAEVNRVLSEKLRQYSTIRLLSPASVSEVVLVNNQWALKIQREDEVDDWRSELLIAADGGQSPLRQMMGLSVQEKDYDQTAIVTSVQLNQPHHYTAYERFISSGPIAFLPVEKDVAAVIITVNNADLSSWKELSDQAFLQRLQTSFGYRLGRLRGLGSRVYYPLKLVTTEQQTAPQFLLIGNAANVLHPIAAQGFNLALRDIAVFAECISTALKNQQSLADPALLATYSTLRQADQQRTVRFTDGLITLFSNPRLGLLRTAAMTGLDLFPPLKTLLGKYGAGTLGPLSRLARGLEL